MNYAINQIAVRMMRFLTSSNKRSNEEMINSLVGTVTGREPIRPHLEDATQTKIRKVLFPHVNLLTAEDMDHTTKVVRGQWQVYKTIMYKIHSRSETEFNQMVAFDLDGTLIKTKSGATFGNDWMFFLPNIVNVLRQQHERGDTYMAIISNQSGVKAGKTTVEEIQKKVDDIISKLGFPIDFVCAFQDDRFRKPRTGMWDFLMSCRCSSLSPTGCTYVGDAAGREKERPRKKDFSDTDIKLALNLGINVSRFAIWFLVSKRLHIIFVFDFKIIFVLYVSYNPVCHSRIVFSSRQRTFFSS